MNWRRISLLAVLCLVAIVPAIGQQATGTISGTIQDATGAFIPGANVTLSSPGVIGGNQSAVTNESGAYRFTRLVPGTYSVKVELPGFRSSERQNIVVNADVTVRTDLVLEVGSVADTVNVTGEAPLLDTTTALNQSVLDRKTLDTLPTGNDLWSIGRMVPGVLVSAGIGGYDVGGSSSYQQGTTSVHGSAGAEQKYAIDGMDVAWAGGSGGSVMVYFDSKMFQEVNYQVGAISAENAQGGVVMNMVTKTGTNTFHGGLEFAGSKGAWQSNNITTQMASDLQAGIPAAVLKINPALQPRNKVLSSFDSSATLSGPIVKDKLWFVSTGRLQALNQTLIGSYNPDATQLVDDNRIKNGSIKASWQMNPNNQLHFTFSRNLKYRYHRTSATAGALFFEADSTRIQAQPANIWQMKWTSTLSPRMITDVNSSLQVGPTPYLPQKNVGPGTIPKVDTVTLVQTGAVAEYDINPQYRGVFNASLSYFVNKHDLKTGYQYSRSMNRSYSWSTSNYPSGMVALYNNGAPLRVQTYNTPTDTHSFIQDNAWFIQDKWQTTRKVTLNLGLRVQKTVGWLPALCQPQTIFIAAQCFSEVRNIPNWLDVAPRFALVYDIFGNGKTALKIAVNRYDVGIGSSHQENVSPIKIVNDTRTWTDSNRDNIPQLSELGPSTGYALGTSNRYNPNLKRPYSNELSAEIQHTIFGDTVVTVGFFHRETKRTIGIKNLLVPQESYIPINVVEKNSGLPVTVYNQAPALSGKIDNYYDNYPQLDGQYNGIDINFNKRMSHRFLLSGGFSRGRNHGDTYTSSSTDLNNPNNNFRRGISGNDIPNSFKLSGIYQLPMGVKFSANLEHFTGAPENTTVTVNATTVALTQVSQSVRTQPRATSRLPNVDLLDISGRRTFRLGEQSRTAEAVVDVFNMLNSNAIQSRITVAGPTFGRVSDILRSRMLRLGFNFNF